MGMIQRGDRAGFLLETRGVLALQPLDGDDAIQARVARLPHFAHAARAEGGEDLVGAEFCACFELHTETHSSLAVQRADCAWITLYPHIERSTLTSTDPNDSWR